MTQTLTRKRRFSTVAEAFSQDAAYWGDNGDWFVVLSQHRDSDALTRSNFAVLREQLGDSAEVESASHWLVGWVEYLIVAPSDRAALRKAIDASKAIENYPILDENHFSQLEWDEFHTYAESELSKFEAWEWALREAMDEHNSGPGDETAEREIIDAATVLLERREAMVERNACSIIDPQQLKLWADVSDRIVPYLHDDDDDDDDDE